MDKKKKILILIVYAILWSLVTIYMISTIFSLADEYPDVEENVLILFLSAVGVWVVFGVVGGISVMDFLDYLGKKQEKKKK